MAQLSESLVREAIRSIREDRKLPLTINEVDQALHAWLKLHGAAEQQSAVHSPEWLRQHKCPANVACPECNPVNQS